jgi:hypothetical protein
LSRPFVHALNEEFRSVAGYYIFLQEGLVEYGGKQILYLLGEGEADTACCGRGRWLYVLVPGTVLDWKGSQDGQGRPISLVDPLEDPLSRNYLKRYILETEGISQVQFW